MLADASIFLSKTNFKLSEGLHLPVISVTVFKIGVRGQ
jgi:hypothetical protein